MLASEIFAVSVIVLVLVVAATIAWGYFTLFVSVFPDNLSFAYIATMIVFLGIVYFIRTAGRDVDRIRTRAAGWNWLSFAIHYLLLFLLSAAGVIRFWNVLL